MTSKKREGRPPTQLRMPQYCFPPPPPMYPVSHDPAGLPGPRHQSRDAMPTERKTSKSSSPYLICFLDKKSVCSWNGVAVSWFSFQRSGSRYPYVFLRA